MALKALIEIEADASGTITAMRQVTAEGQRMEGGLRKTGTTGNVVMTELTKQQRQARDATALLNRYIGEVPPQLQRVLARSQVIGPALASAFNIAVVVGFGVAIVSVLDRLLGFSEGLEQARQKSEAIIESTRRWNEATMPKKSVAEVRQEFVKTQLEISKLQKELGLTGDIIRDTLVVAAQKFTAAVAVNPFDRARALSFTQRLNQLKELQTRSDRYNETLTEMKEFEVSREPIEVLKLQNEARLAGLEGIAKVRAAEAAATADINLNEKLRAVTPKVAAAQRVAAWARARAEEVQLARQAADAIQQIENRVALIGLNEIDQIRERAHQARIAVQEAVGRGTTSRDTAGKNIGLINLEEEKQLMEARRKILIEGNLSILQAATATAHGREQIERQFLVTLNQITQEEIRLGIELKDKRIAAEIEKNAKLIELARQTAEETLRMEEQAALSALPPWQRSYAQISASANQRLREIQQQLERTEISSEDAARRSAAVWIETSAQMKNQLAGDLESLFDQLTRDPMQFFLSQFKRMVFQMIATWLVGMNQMRAGAQGGFGGILQSLLGGLFGQGSGGGFSATGPGGTAGSTPAAGATGQASLLNQLFGGGQSFGSAVPAGAKPASVASIAELQRQADALLLRDLPVNSRRLAGVPSLSNPVLTHLVKAAAKQGALSAFQDSLKKDIQIGSLRINPAQLLSQTGLALAMSGIISGSKGKSAAGGALVGFVHGGPVGAVAGGVAGLLLSLFGGPDKDKLRRRFTELQDAAKGITADFELRKMDVFSAKGQFRDVFMTMSQERQRLLKAVSRDQWDAAIRALVRADFGVIQLENLRRRRGRLAETFTGIPEFASGGMVDMRPLTRNDGALLAFLHRGEGVLTPRGVNAVGGPQAVERANRGEAVTNNSVTIAPGAIVIHAPPGMDEARIAEEVMQRINRLSVRRGRGKVV